MQIGKNSVVTLNYTLKDDEGQVIDSSDGGEPLAYLHGAENIIPGLEDALEGKTAGESLSVSVKPEEAYGVHDEKKVQTVSRDMFEGVDDIHVGAQYHAADPEGHNITITVVELSDDSVVVDANHPLAGMNLNFDVTIMDIREATEEELSHGHVHGIGGHNH